jgi:dihydrofolate synthase / folylpolyglutamate synthase
MTYRQTLEYLYTQLPMFSRVGAAALKPTLDNTLALCAALGNPHHQFPSIHIGGTNGKGSTSHLLAAILQALGLKVGLYISPHYRDFRERIKINGQYIPKKAVKQFVQKNAELFEEIHPSFFEMTVAMAFDYFATEGVDIAVIEVGLGGRLDSTNVIQPLCSVITNISFDHTDLLGESLPKIAFEKAGIIKPNTPIVIGEEHIETLPVFQRRAQEENAPLSIASQNIDSQIVREELATTVFRISQNEQVVFDDLNVQVSGNYQAKNVATVLQTVEVLKTLPFFNEEWSNVNGLNENRWRQAVVNGLGAVKDLTNFIGRWEILGRSPLIIGDSAHNEGGLTLALSQLKSLVVNDLHIVLGFVKDKDIAKVLQLFPQNATYYFCKANITRGLDAQELAEKAAILGLKGKTYPSVKRALAAAKRRAKSDDVVYIGGSIFVLAEVI